MLTKCSCGRYTNYDTTCVSCAMAVSTTDNDVDVDMDDLFMEEEEETKFVKKKPTPEKQ